MLCAAWPAPCDHRVRGRLILVCRRCEAKADTAARLDEVVFTDWAATPDFCPN